MAQVNVRIDDELKEQAEELFEELGLTLSTAFNVFLRQALQADGLPFEVTRRKRSAYNMGSREFLMESLAQIERGEGKTYETVGHVLAERP